MFIPRRETSQSVSRYEDSKFTKILLMYNGNKVAKVYCMHRMWFCVERIYTRICSQSSPGIFSIAASSQTDRSRPVALNRQMTPMQFAYV